MRHRPGRLRPRRELAPQLREMARARHLVAFDPATGAGLRRIRERNEDGLLRTYELLPGDTLGARVPVRGADDAESIAKANRLLEWWASMASLGEFYAPNSAQVPTAGDTRDWAAEPLSAAALCAYDTTLRLGQEEMLRYRARVPRVRRKVNSEWGMHLPVGWWTAAYEVPGRGSPISPVVRPRGAGRDDQRAISAGRLAPRSAVRLLRSLAELTVDHDLMLAMLATLGGAVTAEVLLQWCAYEPGAGWTWGPDAARGGESERGMGERLMGLLDDLRRAGLVDLHVPIQPLPPEPLVSDALLGAYGWDVAGLQAARYERAHSGMGAWRPPLPEAHRVRGDRGGAAATRRDRVRRGLDPLGGEVACQVVTAFTLPAAQYMASRYLDVPGASALGEPDLLPETAPAAREHLMRFLDADGNLRADLARDGSEQSWRGHLAGAARRWWVGAAVLDGLQRWGTEPLHAYYRQATDIAFLRGWRRPEGVHPALERAGTVRSWSEWGTRTMLWTGILANVRHGPSSDSMAVLRLRFVLGEERELTAMIETGVRGPVDVRRRAAHIELVHDRPVGALKPKVHRLLEREGPAQVQASDGLRAWPLEATPPLLIVVPGALSLNGDAPRDRAESVLSMALRHAWYLVRSERLDRPYGVLLLAVCHLQDLRDQGWTAPIWYRLRAPARPPVGVDEDPLSLSMIDWDWQADAPARRSLVDLARSSLPTRAPVQLAGHRDLAGLSIGFRLRLNNGDGWRVVYRSGKTQAI